MTRSVIQNEEQAHGGHAKTSGCREASKKASLLIDSTTLDETRTPLKLPQFEMSVMVAATKALEAWRDEALDGAYICSNVCSHLVSSSKGSDQKSLNSYTKAFLPFFCHPGRSQAVSGLVMPLDLCAVARKIVYMEQGYVTAAFFRHRTFERYRQWQQEQELGRMLDDGEQPFSALYGVAVSLSALLAYYSAQ